MIKHKNFYISLFIVALFSIGLIVFQSYFPDWNNFKQATCMPNSCFSEPIKIIGMRQPINALSSLIYIVLGLYVFLENKLNKIIKFLFSLGFIITGVGSTYYHISLTFLGQTIDVLGMYLISTLILLIAIYRFNNSKRFLIKYLLINIFLLIILIFIPELRRYLFAIILIIGFIVEYYKTMKEKKNINHLIIGFVVMLISFLIWILDNTKVNIFINGHALWHIGNAYASYLLYKHYLICENKI